MKSVTPTELRTNVYKLLDEIIDTGIPIEIERKGIKLKIDVCKPIDKFANLVAHPEFVNGDPDDFVSLNWENEINLDFP